MKNNISIIFRIDDRLIHGQVIVGWVKTLNLNNIIVANDKILKDKMRINVMKIAVPLEIHSEFLSIKETAKSLQADTWRGYKTIILLESPEDAYKLAICDVGITEINVGGLHFQDNRKQITSNLALNETDIEYLFKLHKLNIHLEGRGLPSDEPYDVIKAISRNGNK